MHVLVTGSTGAVGQVVVQHLQKTGCRVRGLARRPTSGLDDFVVGDLSDRTAVAAAVQGADMVIHLGAYPDPADFIEVLLAPNVVGVFHVCEESRKAGVKRIVLASSLQVIGRTSRERLPVTVEDGVAPTNFYALTKVWGEEMGRLYARKYGISVINARIGWMPRNSQGARKLEQQKGMDVYLSHDDAGRFFERCVVSERPHPGECATVFAVSRPVERETLDAAPARDWLGYEPVDTFPGGLAFPYLPIHPND